MSFGGGIRTIILNHPTSTPTYSLTYFKQTKSKFWKPWILGQECTLYFYQREPSDQVFRDTNILLLKAILKTLGLSNGFEVSVPNSGLRWTNSFSVFLSAPCCCIDISADLSVVETVSPLGWLMCFQDGVHLCSLERACAWAHPSQGAPCPQDPAVLTITTPSQLYNRVCSTAFVGSLYSSLTSIS